MQRILLLLALVASFCIGEAQSLDPSSYQQLHWRMIGPFRGGRTVGATGVKGRPGLFYVGVNNGGVWKTDDFGGTWQPIFDDQPTGSVGALAVAPSDPDTIYVGSGEGLQRPDLSVGDGVYISSDGGKTWRNMGLRDGQQIGSIIVDPHDPNRLFVAVLGHPYGPNRERGVFRSVDGGTSWKKVLYKDEDTGAIALAFDPTNSQTVYADLWAGRLGPWENGYFDLPNGGLFKSTDGGETWVQLTHGLPTAADGLGRIGFCVAPAEPSRIYAIVQADKGGGLYRSDDSGASWRLVNDQYRIWGRGDDFAEVRVDPKDPDTVFIANTSTYKTTDGGKTFSAWKGAPGGDDYHTIWIDPDDSKTILLACDQGATITVNGGRTWSSWYNQPTAQFYHVITDNQFPYWVYGAQQESGSVGTSTRGNDGEITFRDWHPVGAEEYGYIAPDPLNPNIIYGGKVSKFDRVTGQVQDVGPAGNYRALRTAPLEFSPVDPHTLYFAGNILFKSADGAHSWSVISPDLSREHPEVPEGVGIHGKQRPTVERRGVIYALGLSPLDHNLIWAGTDDGQIDFTRDGGKTWLNVTPPDMTSWSKVSMIDAGHFDKATAYVAVNRIRLDDMRPHILVTHDYGKTWSEVVNGLPNDAPVNTVKEDPKRKGLLFCGTERAVFFSRDEGGVWRSLRQNMPATSIRDLVVHGDDLVVATHGRSFWILDDITSLRQIRGQPMNARGGDLILFKPEDAYRYRRDTNTDTPLPPEVPAGTNPPDGAILDYWLPHDVTKLTLEIDDSAGRPVRVYSSDDKPDPVDPDDLDVPTYWIRPFQQLETGYGSHRFVWDLRLQPLQYVPYYDIAAVFRDTPSFSSSPLAPPGHYTVKLTFLNEVGVQPLTLMLDPRVKTPASGIQREFELAKACYDAAKSMRAELIKRNEKPSDAPRYGRRKAPDTFSGLSQAYEQLMNQVDRADATPTAMMEQEFVELNARAAKMRGG